LCLNIKSILFFVYSLIFIKLIFKKFWFSFLLILHFNKLLKFFIYIIFFYEIILLCFTWIQRYNSVSEIIFFQIIWFIIIWSDSLIQILKRFNLALLNFKWLIICKNAFFVDIWFDKVVDALCVVCIKILDGIEWWERLVCKLVIDILKFMFILLRYINYSSFWREAGLKSVVYFLSV
jgi:hypothetical protein